MPKKIYFKIDCDFNDRNDKAYFYYSLDGKNGCALEMTCRWPTPYPILWAIALGFLTMPPKLPAGMLILSTTVFQIQSPNDERDWNADDADTAYRRYVMISILLSPNKNPFSHR
jgi:hypothetical protein